MPVVIKDFDSYKIWYYSGYPTEVIVNCYHGGDYVGRISFYRDDSTIPPNVNYSIGPTINYPLSRFDDIIGILRYEKPLYLLLNLGNLVWIVATAEQEPVGEQEV